MKSLTLILAAAALTTAAPTFQVSDITILQYALTLEHLENKFYSIALEKFSPEDYACAGVSNDVYENVKLVARDEADHVLVLTNALGDKAVKPCQYNFGEMKRVEDFLNTAAILEGVGVSAYLGAAGDISSKAYLSVAGSILTTEARHSSYIRGNKPNPLRPFAAPYDVGLDYRQVFTLAAGFIVPGSCPMDLGLKTFPSLTIGAANTYSVGNTITLTADTKSSCKDTLYAGFTIPGVGASFVAVGDNHSVRIPKGAAGQTYVVLQCGKETPKAFADDSIVAGPAIVEVS